MAYPNYYGNYSNYGYGYMQQPGGGAEANGYGYGYMQQQVGVGTDADGSYNPRYHFAAAQHAGFELTPPDDGQARTLYVGNLDPLVSEEFITTLFSQMGVVVKTKVIYDGSSDPYAFVQFADHKSASDALQAMNQRQLLNREMKVNWATHRGPNQQKLDTSKHFHVFVGDLAPDVDNKMLTDAFSPFGSVSEVKIIKDPTTQKSKGYGFVSFPRREEAERAIESMNGQWLGRRTIRTNWATRKPAAAGSSTSQPFNKSNFEERNQAK